MGIQGLLPFLKSIHRESHLRIWAGKTLAVDGYVWLHRGVYSCAEELCLGKPTSKHVDYFLQRIDLLRRNEVSAYVVFDGDHLPSKKRTEDDRENRRRTALTKANKFLAQGNLKNARDEFVKAVDVTPQLAHDVIIALRSAGVKFVVAPYEADAQLRYLEMKGEVDAIITEDSDLLVYGARNVLFKLDHSGHCVHICRDEFGLVEDKRMSLWTDSEFRQMAMLSGCDYLSSIPGLGIKKANDLIRRLKTAQRAIKATRLDGKLTVPPKYEQSFQEAELTFLHQFVYDSDTRSMVPLNPLPDPPPGTEHLAGCGEKWPDQVAIDVAEGRLDPLTKEFFSAKPSGIKISPMQARNLNQQTPAREINKQTPRNSSYKRPAVSSSQQQTLQQFSFRSTPKTTCSKSVRTSTSNILQSIDNQNSEQSEEHISVPEKPSKFFEDQSNQGAESSCSPSFELDLESQGFVATQTTTEDLASEPAQTFTQESWGAISDVPTDGSISGQAEEVKSEMQLEPMSGEDLPSSQMQEHPVTLPTIELISHSKSRLSKSRSPLSNNSASASNKENHDPITNNQLDSSVCPSSSQGNEDQTFMKFSDSDIISSEPDESVPTLIKPRVTIITPTNHHTTASVVNRRRVSEPISRHTNQFPISSDPILSSDDKAGHDEMPNTVLNKRKTIQLSSRVHQSYKKSSQGFIETPLSKLSKGVKRSASVANHDEELSPSLARVASGIRNRFTFQKASGKPKLFDFSKYKNEDNIKGEKRVSEHSPSNRQPLLPTVLSARETTVAAPSDQSIGRDQVDYQTRPTETFKRHSRTEPALTPLNTPAQKGSSNKLSMFLFKGNVDHYSHGI